MSTLTWNISEHGNNLLSGNFFNREVFVFIVFFSYKITNSWQINPCIPSLPSHPLQFLLRDLFPFLQKRTNRKDSRGIDSKSCKNRHVLPKHIKARQKRSLLFFQRARNILVGVPHLVRPAEFKTMCAKRDCMSVCMLFMCAM